MFINNNLFIDILIQQFIDITIYIKMAPLRSDTVQVSVLRLCFCFLLYVLLLSLFTHITSALITYDKGTLLNFGPSSSSRESVLGQGPSVAISPVLAWLSMVLRPDFSPRQLSIGDSHQERSPLTGRGHDPSPPPRVVEAVGVALRGQNSWSLNWGCWDHPPI